MNAKSINMTAMKMQLATISKDHGNAFVTEVTRVKMAHTVKVSIFVFLEIFAVVTITKYRFSIT